MLIKNILDRFFAIILIVLLSPILLIISLAIKVDSRGPIIFKQRRLGKDGDLFKIYKFRTMYVDAPDIRNKDGSTFNSDNDCRVTKVGKLLRKTSLDELMQLFNIAKGEMSFIGPRPDLPEQLDKYTNNQLKKLNMKPGITGYSQAYYRNSIIAEEKFNNDVFYVEKYSIALDIKILIKTFTSVIFKKNINNNGYYTINDLEIDLNEFNNKKKSVD
ncbi:sugar transferase [Paraclostridium dentum]|uniref:sugar transferase n=1 Tax=Paraclostridium dentum TaxID=2662455 RepID=UPI001D019551|nr:sugar transferase [Paraclostridium dentum]